MLRGKYFRQLLIVLSIQFLSPGMTWSNEFHYNNMLIGDRASGLGGAYIAISDDPSGLYYNPSGIVYSNSSNLSASMNAYHITRTAYQGVLGGSDWVRTSTMLVPNFFGVTQPFAGGTLGFSYAVIDSALEDQDQTFLNIPGVNDKFTINFNNQDQTYVVGPSYARFITKNLSLGMTIYAYAREQEQIFNQIFEFTDANEFHWENGYFATEEYGYKPIIGIMYTPLDKVSLGLTFSATSLVHSSLKRQDSCASTYQGLTDSESCAKGVLIRQKGAYTSDRMFPFEVGLGGTWFVNSALLLTGSINYYSPINYAKPTINFAGGMELYLNDTLAVRLGTYTNFANTPEMNVPGAYYFQEHIDMYGGSMSVSSFTRSSSLTIGLNGSIGKGMAQIIGSSTDVQPVSSVSLTAFMSAGYSY